VGKNAENRKTFTAVRQSPKEDEIPADRAVSVVKAGMAGLNPGFWSVEVTSFAKPCPRLT